MNQVLSGYNGAIFMYGQTTSGKTFTMLGEKSSPGILPCAVRDIFSHIEEHRNEAEYRVWVSYLEIYNESVCDLFTKESANLKLISSERFGTDVSGLQK